MTVEGKRPFPEWLAELKDQTARVRIYGRLARAEMGNFGDWKSLENAGGICEMRDHYGGGYRIILQENW